MKISQCHEHSFIGFALLRSNLPQQQLIVSPLHLGANYYIDSILVKHNSYKIAPSSNGQALKAGQMHVNGVARVLLSPLSRETMKKLLGTIHGLMFFRENPIKLDKCILMSPFFYSLSSLFPQDLDLLISDLRSEDSFGINSREYSRLISPWYPHGIAMCSISLLLQPLPLFFSGLNPT